TALHVDEPRERVEPADVVHQRRLRLADRLDAPARRPAHEPVGVRVRQFRARPRRGVRTDLGRRGQEALGVLRRPPTRRMGHARERRLRRHAVHPRRREGSNAVTADSGVDVAYDPYDLAINTDPYPVFRRLREEAPLYYNEQFDFYALSR